jgi:phosphoglycolate phosphatase-like HAD superfamily hydrolase
VTAEVHAPCANADCDKCDPRPRWKITEHRIQHITYTREIKAATREEALQIFESGTAWPSAYDDHYGEIVQQDEPVAEQITDEHVLKYHREECCWNTPKREQEMTKFLARGESSDDENVDETKEFTK